MGHHRCGHSFKELACSTCFPAGPICLVPHYWACVFPQANNTTSRFSIASVRGNSSICCVRDHACSCNAFRFQMSNRANMAFERDAPKAARPSTLRWATPKPNQKRMRTQQTKLTPHRFAQPEKISQPGAQSETPSPSFTTAAACLAALPAPRNVASFHSPQEHSAAQSVAHKTHSAIASPSANNVVMLMFPLCVVSPTRRSSGTCRKRPAP